MPDPVELVGGDPGCDVSTDLGERLAGDPAGDAHPLDGLGVLTSEPVGRVADLRPTYSGRSM